MSILDNLHETFNRAWPDWFHSTPESTEPCACTYCVEEWRPIYAVCNERMAARAPGTKVFLPYLPESLLPLRPKVDPLPLILTPPGIRASPHEVDGRALQAIAKDEMKRMNQNRTVMARLSQVVPKSYIGSVTLDSFVAGKPNAELATRVALVPTTRSCEHYRTANLILVPVHSVRALLPLLPNFLPPIGPGKVKLVLVNVPSPRAFVMSVYAGIMGDSFDFLRNRTSGKLSARTSKNADDMAKSLIDYFTSTSKILEPNMKLFESILSVMCPLVRTAFNYNILGVWYENTWEHLEFVYAGCMRALLMIGATFSLRMLCSGDKLRELAGNAPTFGDLYADAVGIERPLSHAHQN